MEQQLSAGLGERKIAKLVHNDEVEPGDKVGKTPLLTITRFRFKTIDEIDDVVEAPARAVADQGTGKCNGQMGFSSASSSNENDIVLLGKESSARELAHQSFVDRRVSKVEVVDVLGRRQLCDGDLVFD